MWIITLSGSTHVRASRRMYVDTLGSVSMVDNAIQTAQLDGTFTGTVFRYNFLVYYFEAKNVGSLGGEANVDV